MYIFSLYGRLTVGRTKGCTCVSIYVPPHMRSNAVGGGGVLYFKLGVGRCNYDASTIAPLSNAEQNKVCSFDRSNNVYICEVIQTTPSIPTPSFRERRKTKKEAGKLLCKNMEKPQHHCALANAGETVFAVFLNAKSIHRGLSYG